MSSTVANSSGCWRFPVQRPALVLLIVLGLSAVDVAAQQSVTVSRDRLRRLAPNSVKSDAVRLSERGVDTVTVAATGLQLKPGTLTVLAITGALAVVPGPVPNEPAASRPGELEERNPFIALPYKLLAPDATGTGTWVLRPIYKLANRLRWNADSAAFVGALLVAVEDTSRRSESRPLPTPVRFEVAGEVNSAQIELTHTNFPLTRVNLVADAVADSVRVQLIPEFDVNGTEVWVPVQPHLIIDAPRRMQGWGIASARVVVRATGIRVRTPVGVALSADAGELDTTAVVLGGAAIGSTRLRSGSIGPVTLTASAPGYTSEVTTIQFVWPFVFFAMALIGGVLGGLGGALLRRRSAAAIRWTEYGLKGAVAGIIAALAWYALGINLLHINIGVPRFNDLAVFTFATLAGLLGIQIGRAEQVLETPGAKADPKVAASTDSGSS